MNDIQAIRRCQLSKWVDSNKVIPINERSYFSQLLNGIASFGEKAARRLEKQYHMGDGYLDTPGMCIHVSKDQLIVQINAKLSTMSYDKIAALLKFID